TDCQRVGGVLDYLVDVGIIKRIAGHLAVMGITLEHGGCTLEVSNAPRLLTFLEGERDGNGPVDLNPRRPEEIVEVDRRERNGLYGVIARRNRTPAIRGARIAGK